MCCVHPLLQKGMLTSLYMCSVVQSANHLTDDMCMLSALAFSVHEISVCSLAQYKLADFYDVSFYCAADKYNYFFYELTLTKLTLICVLQAGSVMSLSETSSGIAERLEESECMVGTA